MCADNCSKCDGPSKDLLRNCKNECQIILNAIRVINSSNESVTFLQMVDICIGEKRKCEKKKYYGMFKVWEKRYVERLLIKLLFERYLDQYPVDRTNNAGVRVATHYYLKIGKNNKYSDPFEMTFDLCDINGSTAMIQKELYARRGAIASRDEQTEENILSDAAIRKILEALPQTKEDISNIAGINTEYVTDFWVICAYYHNNSVYNRIRRKLFERREEILMRYHKTRDIVLTDAAVDEIAEQMPTYYQHIIGIVGVAQEYAADIRNDEHGNENIPVDGFGR